MRSLSLIIGFTWQNISLKARLIHGTGHQQHLQYGIRYLRKNVRKKELFDNLWDTTLKSRNKETADLIELQLSFLNFHLFVFRFEGVNRLKGKNLSVKYIARGFRLSRSSVTDDATWLLMAFF